MGLVEVLDCCATGLRSRRGVVEIARSRLKARGKSDSPRKDSSWGLQNRQCDRSV